MDSIDEYKSVGTKNYYALKKEKEKRKNTSINTDEVMLYPDKTRGIKDSFYEPKTGKSVEVPRKKTLPFYGEITENRQMLDKNSQNYSVYKKSRCDNKIPKCHRDNDGINRGKPGGCRFCNREIYKRMKDTADIRLQIRNLKKTNYEIE